MLEILKVNLFNDIINDKLGLGELISLGDASSSKIFLGGLSQKDGDGDHAYVWLDDAMQVMIGWWFGLVWFGLVWFGLISIWFGLI